MKTQIFSRIIACLIIVFSSFYSFSKTIYVNDGSQTNDIYTTAIGKSGNTGSKSSPFVSLKDALAVVVSNDTIYVDAGKYSGSTGGNQEFNLNINKDNLTIIGAGMEKTTFYSNNNKGTFLTVLANNFNISNLKIQKYGYSTGGGDQVGHAVTIGNATNTYTGIVFSDILFDSNGGGGGETAIYIKSKTSTIFTGGGASCNTAGYNYGGGITVDGTKIDLQIINFVFAYNSGDGAGGKAGGAIRIRNGDATQKILVKNSLFSKNEASSDFHAMDMYITSGDIKVYDCIFEYSKSQLLQSGKQLGGSVYISSPDPLKPTSVKFSRSVFKNHSCDGDIIGAAIANVGGNLSIDSCHFYNNIASSGQPKDVYCSSGSINASYCTWSEVGQSLSGVFNMVNSGNPIVKTGTVNKSNTILSSFLPNPILTNYKGNCTSSVKICSPATYSITLDCITKKATVTANGLGTFKWYNKQTGGTVFHTGSSYVTSVLNADTTLYLQYSMDACDSLVPVKIAFTCPSCNTKISYPSDSVCKASTNPIPTVSDGSAGTYKVTPSTGLVFKFPTDPSKGEIDLVSSSPGKYTITFTADAIPTCQPTFEITILQKPSKVDTISFVEPTCKIDGKVQIKSYVSTAKYGFKPAGLSISNSGLISGTSGSFKLAVSIAGCVSDSLDLIFAAVPNKPKISSADTTICMGTTLQLTGTGIAKTWALASNLGIASIVNGKITPTKAGTVRVGYTNFLDCTDSSTVHIDPLAVAGSFGAKTDSICSNLSTKITLTGYTGKIQWQSSTDTTNSKSWTNIVGANSPSYDTPKLSKGNYFYRASVSSGTCIDTVKSIIKIVVVSDSPVIGSIATSSDTICAGNFANLNFVNGVGKIKLEQSSTDASGPWSPFSGTTISPTNFKTQILNSTMFYKVSVSNGKCTNIDTVVKVVVIPIPADLIMSNTSPVFCKSDKKTVSDLKQLTTNLTKKITWYDNLNVNTSLAFNDKDTLISRTYYAEQSEGACKSVNRVSVNVSIVDLPKPQLVGNPIHPSCTVAKGAVNINLPSNGSWYVKATPTTIVGSMKDTTATLTTIPYTLKFENLSPGSYLLQLKDANGCLSRDTSFIINPQPTIPAKPVLDGAVIYCASNTYTLDKIVFNPKPNPSASESIKYFDEKGWVITNPSLVTVKPNEKYKFVFNNGSCDSKDTLKEKIPMDNGPTLPSNGNDLSLTGICAVEKPTFNTLFAKLPGIADTSLYYFYITPDTLIKPINYLPNKTSIGSNGGNLQNFFYTLADKVNGCKNTVFAKLSFKLDEGPKNLNIKSSQLFCGFSNPTVAKLDTAATKANLTNSFVWYYSATSTTSLPSNTPLVSGTYYGAEKENPGCESVLRNPVLVTIENFGPTNVNSDNVYTFCKGSNKIVSDLPIAPYTTTIFVWLDSYKKQIANNTALIPGTYYAAEFKNGCISDKSQAIDVKFVSPIISISPSKLPTCGVGNGALTIIGVEDNFTYQWHKNNIALIDSTKSFITNLPFDYTVEYKVIVKDKNGCVDSAKTKFSDCEPPGIPHVITLNKDGKNDVFKLHYDIKYPKCKLSIFNRWGTVVYESKETPYKDDWDGKPNVAGTIGSGELPTGTYFYLIDKGDGSALETGYIELVK